MNKYIVQIRLTPEEREMLEVLRKRKGLKRGPYLKMLIHEEHEKYANTKNTQTRKQE